MSKRVDEQDDGRVIAPMNVDGMPWYRPGRREKNKAPGDLGAAGDDGAAGSTGAANSAWAGFPEKLTFRENMAFAFGVLKAVLLIAVIFAGALLAFILFCLNVWLK